MAEELWTSVHNIVQEAVTKTIPPKKYTRKQSGSLRKALQIPKQRRKVKGKKEKESYIQLNVES